MDGSEAENSLRLYGETVTSENPESHPWTAGVAGGMIGGIGMGVILHAGGGVMPFIGALYGWPTVTGGWAAHMVHSVLIGVLFAVIVSRPGVREQTASISECLVFAVVYAAAVGLVTGGLMLPVSMAAIGASAFPQPPLLVSDIFGGGLVAVSIGVAHVVYGLLLGATYGTVNNRTKIERRPQ